MIGSSGSIEHRLPSQRLSLPMTSHSALQILMLDDEPFMLELLGQLLTGLGYEQLVYHTNGAEALKSMAAPNGMPDVILLDINMPCMDGVEFVRHLGEQHFAGDLILISSEDELMLRATEKLAHSYHLAVRGHLPKPPNTFQLANLLDQTCFRGGRQNPETSKARERKNYNSAELKIAIEQGQIINYYQPKVSVSNGELVGVEALVRWLHPEDGLVFPDRFIPVAEAYQLIDLVTETVVKNALKQVIAWQQQGLAVPVAINVSMDNLLSVEFADFMIAESTKAGVPPQLLVLEVTESRLMQNMTVALDVLTRLRLKRFRLAIDDFGTGHSSLAQLRDFPFDELKIDQGFTHRAWEDERLKAIFEASLELALHLKMQAVAEGVEDFDDWRFLSSIGCETAQGYFIARPMPSEQLPVWLQEWQQRLQQAPLLVSTCDDGSGRK